MIRRSKPSCRVVLIAVIAASALGACAQVDTAGEVGAPRTTEGDGQNAVGALTLTTADSEFGEIVVDEEGMTVYVFDNDTAGSGSSCEGGCLEMWPAVTTSDTPTGEGIDAELGMITRTDGSAQTTINGLPLYYYAPDEQPGDVNGQAVGGVWWVVGPDGEKITDAEGPGGPSRY